MNKRVVAIVIALAVVIVAGTAAYALTRPSEPSTGAQPTESMPAQSVAPDEPTAASTTEPTDAGAEQPATAGAYVDYSDTAIANAQGTVLLFFHAPWCPQCRSLEADILAQGVPAGVTIIKVDYDTHQDLRQKYGVTQQTTFVEVDATGAGLQNYVAYQDPQLQAVLDAML